ncbi:MAG: prephenate dehydratase [Thiobacillaceae bacterium]|nr:prephenate dehydratase [Thiobacillaceae bacterium]MCX7673782.1 prephenate dehydratase [Thiobacillaceae bacterium]MDW8323348.1 prephenate dehydratase [Burkholderiales bacterium]
MDAELNRLRGEIDAIDDRLLALMNERARLAQAVGRVKNGQTTYRPEREAQVVRRMLAANTGPLPAEAVERLYRELMSACRALEEPLTVAYLGPEGTFSEAAALKQFGHAVRTLPMSSIDEVFRVIERGEAHCGVVPVENSTEGAVNRTLDLLLVSPLMICGEVMLRIRQHLLRKGEGLEGIRVVYSHAQSLAQCHDWLNGHLPQAQRIRVTSNGEAARMAAEDATAAAVAGEIAAERYGLTIVARDIEDDPNNTTRFLVLAREDAAPSGQDKTSLVLSTKNKPGTLLTLLTPFARNGISLTKLESRPVRNGLWEYVFYLDIEGHRRDEAVRRTLQEVEPHTTLLKVLGSYPMAVNP